MLACVSSGVAGECDRFTLRSVRSLLGGQIAPLIGVGGAVGVLLRRVASGHFRLPVGIIPVIEVTSFAGDG